MALLADSDTASAGSPTLLAQHLGKWDEKWLNSLNALPPPPPRKYKHYKIYVNGILDHIIARWW